MAVGFWLKWSHLPPGDPEGWLRYSWGQMAYSDLVALYLQRGLVSHPIPYVQSPVEYPVIIGVVQYLAAFAPGVRGYFLVSSLALAAAGLGLIWLLYRLSSTARLWILVATPPLFLYAALNWDLLALLFALLSLYLFEARKDGWSGLALGLGIWTKLFPAVLLPWMLMQRLREGDRQRVGLLLGTVVVTSIALNLPVYLASPTGWRYFLDFQGARPPDGGSVWTYLSEWPVWRINDVSLGMMVAGVALLQVATIRGGGRVADFCVGALALLILLSKVTSPQYDLWLMPFLVLARVPGWLVAAFLGIDLAYFWGSFQILYLIGGGQSAAVAANPVFATTIAAHQGVLLVLVLWAVRGGTGAIRPPGSG